ncbi:GNAT family N-acetyltransferase [Heyndrickxia sp. MSNUG]|uniref:GNAT family N-acetyltransferase n=1 Tax=Heyndrickxia sp. MSNUG TaxID=3136677 RepID=UPI003C2DD053
MGIIQLQKEEIKAALDLVWAVFQEFQAPDYSEQGIEEFQKFIFYHSNIEQYKDGKVSFWGWKEDGEMAGVIATKGKNHISMLFVKKEYHRQGIARRLFQAVEEACKNTNGISEITVNSSPFAVTVYKRLGFIETDNEQFVNGIRFTPMSYLIK